MAGALPSQGQRGRNRPCGCPRRHPSSSPSSSSSCASTKLSITLVARNSPRSCRHAAKKRGDFPPVEASQAPKPRACRSSRCRCSARRHAEPPPDAARRAATQTSEDRRPKTAPLVRHQHGLARRACNVPSRDPPNASGDYYTNPISTTKVNSTGTKEPRKKFRVAPRSQDRKSNISDTVERRNGTREIQNKYIGNVISNEHRGKAEDKEIVSGHCNNEKEANRLDDFRKPSTQKHSACPRHSSPVILRLLDPHISPTKPATDYAGFVGHVTESEKHLLNEISKISKPVVFMRHIDSPASKSNQPMNKARKAVDLEVKVIKKVDSFTQTSKESVSCDWEYLEEDKSKVHYDLPANDERKTTAAGDFIKSKQKENKKFGEELTRVLKNSSKFISLQMPSSDSSQRSEWESAGEALGRPRRPSGPFVAQMALEFEPNTDGVDEASPPRAKGRPHSTPHSKGNGASCLMALSPSREMATFSVRYAWSERRPPRRKQVRRPPEEEEGGEWRGAWQEPPLPPLPARPHALATAPSS